MSNEDIIKQRGTLKNYKDDRGSAVLYSHPIIGIVKHNIDKLRSGTIQVYLKRLNAQDENDPDNWTTIHYSSPFFGYTPNTGSPNSDGTFKGNRNSYGFWATPPDIGTEVICVFINGDPSLGYYVGSIPPHTLTHMVPAVAGGTYVIPNPGEAESYGGATVLPVTEYNDANNKQDTSPLPIEQPRPVHSYQAAVMNKQGLIRDPDRGPISSSSTRESPSRVFGMSTPGRPIYKGGYDGRNQPSIKSAINDPNVSDENLQIVGRLGGHSLVMDDGDLSGKDQLMRFRTSQGHMILMNDAAQTLFIIHANGQSYIEMGKEGTIDMYATNSVNIRTQGDLNLHADNNVNINAGNQFNMSAKNVKTQSTESTTQFTGTTFKQFTKGDHTLKVNSKMSFDSKGDSSLKSGGTNYINGGPNILLNSGSSSLNPEEIKQLTIIAHTDTLYSDTKGYVPSPGKLESIVSRAPAHAPWAEANKGVNVKTNLDAGANLPSAPSNSLNAINQSVQNAPVKTTTPAIAATVPISNSNTSTLAPGTAAALASQLAVNASNGSAKDAIASGAGIVSGTNGKMASISPYALNPSQLVASGYLKPGSDIAINKLIQEGKTLDQAIPSNIWTGKEGIGSTQSFLASPQAQTNATVTMLGQGEKAMRDAGVITGNESTTQTAGVILSAVTAGVPETLNFVKTASSSSTNVDKPYSPITTNGIKSSVTSILNKISNPFPATPSNAIASGNNAANMADKSTSGMSGAKVEGGLKGAVAGIFDKIVSGFKSLKPNTPQTLTASTSVSSNPGVPGVPNIPGGQNAVGSTINLDSATSPSSTVGSIKSRVQNAISNPQASTSEFASLVNSKGGINNVAGLGLDPELNAELQGAINSLGAGGPLDIKTATTTLNSFDFNAIQSQSNSLLGDIGVPPLSFGAIPKIPTTPLTEDKVKEYNALKLELTKQDDLKWDLRKTYYDIKQKYGDNATETITAENNYKQCLQKIETIRQEIAKVSTS